jgi:ADP-heptose:LPS heptosyltransferase
MPKQGRVFVESKHADMSERAPQNVVIYSIGSLGDTLATVPALWAIRQHWPQARLSLLSDIQIGRALIAPQEILDGAGLIDKFLNYPVQSGQQPLMGRWKSAMTLWNILRRERPAALVYLIRAFDGDSRVRRDLTFFRLAGLRYVVGGNHLPRRPRHNSGMDISSLPRLADSYLQRLAADGIPVPAAGQGRLDIGLAKANQESVDEWREPLSDDGGRSWVAFGAGSKMPAKVWPWDRYEAVGRKLIENFDVWPVVFGGIEDKELGMQLVSVWGRGHVAAGELNVRVAAAALSRCLFYVGNDTGTMHLAAAAGIPCVAIFSARDYPGLWEPYGGNHKVLRFDVPCSGCRLAVCDKNLECLNGISIQQVYEACVELMAKQRADTLKTESRKWESTEQK